MKKLNVKPVEELSQFINEANTSGNLLQDVPILMQSSRKSTKMRE